jgi:hypothetical protein
MEVRMRLIVAFAFAGFLGTAVVALGSTLVIDNFTCPASVSQTGLGATNSTVSCPGALGGFRQDTISVDGFTGDFTTAENSVSTLNSNPPADAITGTIGSGLVGGEIMIWGASSVGVYDLPHLDLSGDSILVQIESSSGGTLDVNLVSTSGADRLGYAATFAASSNFEDVLIPLTNPTIIGTGASVNNVIGIGLEVGVSGGGTWTIDGVDAVEAVPEPSPLMLITGICLLGVLTRSYRQRRRISGLSQPKHLSVHQPISISSPSR